MEESDAIIDLNQADPGRFRSWGFDQSHCVTCGVCSASCPATGTDGFDPRKLVRMVMLGLENQVVEARWPWICTMCGKCENLCPMGVNIADMVRQIRSLRPREAVPGILHKGVEAALDTGNNLRLPKEDYVFILEDVAEEIAEEPGFEGFTVPVDKTEARILTTIHNKLVNTHTEDLKHWWKIFHAAGENWTVPSQNWEGTSWGYFSGDDDAMRIMAGRLVDQMERLRARGLLWCE